MAIPDFQTIMLPLLKFVSDEKEHTLREAISSLSVVFKLSEDEKKELTASITKCKKRIVSMKNYDTVAKKIRCGCDSIKYEWK